MEIQANTVINRPPSVVFTFLSDLEKLPQWEGSFEKVKRQSPGPIQVGDSYWCMRKQPQVAESRMILTQYDPDRRLAFEGDWVGFLKPQANYVLEPVEGGTKITSIGHPQVRGPFSLIAPLLLPLMGKRLSITYLENLKRLIEASENSQS